MAYIYRHIRLDKNEPFYIGIGSDDKYRRAYSIQKGRNPLHQNILDKSEVEVEILLDGLTWEEACEKEREFIKLYGRKDLGLGCLCNLTDGGEGAVNRINSAESNIKRSNSLIGRHVSADSKEKNRQSHLGKVLSESDKKRKSDALKDFYSKNEHHSKGKAPWNKGKKGISEETRKKLSEGRKGKPIHTEESRAKIAAAAKNRVRKPVSEETKQKIRESLLNKRSQKNS